MANYPATQNTGTLVSIIKAISSHGVPTKFTTKDLPVWGYKSSHDRSVISVLRFIGFLDGSGVPTDLWREARTSPEIAVGKGVLRGYSELFSTFPSANRKDAESLTNFFKAKTDASEAGVKKIVSTFKALAQIGSFDGLTDDDPASAAPLNGAEVDPGRVSIHPRLPTGQGFAVNMNIELSLPADATGEVYEKFFAAMKKHLLNASV